MSESTQPLLGLTAQIVAAHASHNPVSSEVLLRLIESVYRALAGSGQAATVEEVGLRPAVPIKRSVFADHIVCLEDGKKLVMLKRHLRTTYSMTPEQYRQKWGLPANYPMVAPDYAARRSELAKTIGLGHKPPGAEPPVVKPAAAKPASAKTPAAKPPATKPAPRARRNRKAAQPSAG
jgi:predicted transcriptional regulator